MCLSEESLIYINGLATPFPCQTILPEHRQTKAVTFDESTLDYTKVFGLKWELQK